MPSVEMGEVNLVQEIMQCGVGAIVRTVAERKTQVLDEEEADNELSQLLRLESRIIVAGYCVFFFLEKPEFWIFKPERDFEAYF